MQKHALLIGVERYLDLRITPLLFATADVMALEARLRDRCGFDEVRVLADAPGCEAPDLHHVLRALDETAAELAEEDLFLFYFSGHGIERDGRGYLLTADSSQARPQLVSLSKEVLSDTLHGVRARRRVLLFDACRNAPETGKGAADNLMAGAVSRDMVAMAQSAPDAGVTTALLSACKEGTRAFEWPKWGHGVFTHFLLEGLDGAAWDGGVLDFRKLARHTIRQVQEFTSRAQGIPHPQTPWYQEFGAAGALLLGGGALATAARPQAPPPVPVARREWHYLSGTEQCGPVSLEVLTELAESGTITAETLVWRAGMTAWTAVGEVRELAGHLRSAPLRVIVPPAPAQKSGQDHGLAAGTVWTFADIEMVWCPPGEFLMGSPESDDMACDDEKPQHRVQLTEGLWLGKYPVTQAQWEAVMGDNPSCFKGPDRPVECISWDDCQVFCRKLARGGEGVFRLPTEAEWEYACRAGMTTRWCFGDDVSRLRKYAWYKDNSENETVPVGKLRPNAWGIHDMHGDVWEWCAGWDDDYPWGLVTNPIGPASGQFRVLRGGSCYSNPTSCRSAARYISTPNQRVANNGIRVVRTP